MFLLYFLWCCCCCVLLSFFLAGRKLSQLMANNKQITGHQCVQFPPVRERQSFMSALVLRPLYIIRNPTILPPGTNVPFFLPFFLYTIKFDPLLFFCLFHLEIPTHTEQRKKKSKRSRFIDDYKWLEWVLKIPSINQRQQILHGGDLVHAILFF